MPRVLGDPELNCDRTRLVHGEQAFTFHRPIPTGATVSLGATILGIEDRHSGQLLRILQRLAVRFARPVCVPDTVRTEIWASGGDSYRFEVRDSSDQVVLSQGVIADGGT